MKELTTEEKAERYDKALDNARHYHSEMEGDVCCVLEECFPELKESKEDVWIPKEIIKYLKEKGDFRSCWIVWLENYRDRAKDIVAYMLENKINGIQRELIEFLSNTICAKWTDILKSADCYAQRIRNIIEKQDEKKSVDKVEPKFHEGDWIVHNATGIIHQIKYPIENVTNKTYGYDLIDGGYISSNDAINYHLWTIQDAKDGNVLIGKKDVVLSEIKRRLNELRFLSSTEAKYKYEAYNDLYEWAKQL